MSSFKGKVMLIANIATKCGFAKQSFKEFEILHNKYADKGLVILAFPSGQFGQEPKNDTELKDFVKEANIKWHIFAKCNVNGDNSIAMFKWLKHKTESEAFITKTVKWNFTKFLIDKDGQPVARHGPNTNPLAMEEEIRRELEK